MQSTLKKILPHFLVFVGFIILSLAYFSPVLQGKKILQSDIVQYNGMAKQQRDFKAETGKETYWTNSAFGGMPTYQLGARYPHNYIKKLDLALRFLPRPADYLFLYFIGFYILLLCLKVDFKLAALGALTFGFSTYLIIILGVGHNSKAHAIAYMPLVLSGIVLTFRRKYILGFIVTAIAMALELVANHFQMTYYLLLLVIVLGVCYLIDAYKKGFIKDYFKAVGILVVAVILGIALNATSILATQEYVKESVRGKSELTINPDGSERELTTGLSREYITEYSYGLLESFNLYIPRFLGGGSMEDVGKDSSTYQAFINMGATPLQALEEVSRTPTYWGDQTIVEAPAYIGAVVLFLFVFALFLVKGRLKWWLVGGSVLSLILSYGDSAPFEFITNFFIDYVPLYNKFRAVSSIQILLELCIPVFAIFGLVKLFNNFEKEDNKIKALKYTAIITAGLCVFFLLFKSMLFDFSGVHDKSYSQAYGLAFIDAVKDDRKALLTMDTYRTLILVGISIGIVFMYLKKRVSENTTIILFGILVLFDLVQVDKRYVNNEDFVSARRVDNPYVADNIDKQILKDKSNYRVLDVASSSGPSRTSYFHNSLTGYHAARLNHINEVFDFHILKDNINVVNMLNVKYVIGSDRSTGKKNVLLNKDANGSAWFIKKLKFVETADQEILELETLKNKEVALIRDTNVASKLKREYELDSLASIKVIDHKPNHIKLSYNNSNDGFMVLSELYYKNGWNAYIDNNLIPHYKVNYLLRAIETPEGEHTVEFKFEPQVVKTGSTITLFSSILLGMIIIGSLFYSYKMKND